jgi:hypothetical protein
VVQYADWGERAARWSGIRSETVDVHGTKAHYLVTDQTRIVYAVGFAGSGVTLNCGPLVRDLLLGPTTANPDAVLLRAAMRTTRIPTYAALKLTAGIARKL